MNDTKSPAHPECGQSTIAERLASVQRRIESACAASGREAAEITLLAVSKTKPVEDVRAAVEAGQRHFGESYVQDALSKLDAGEEKLGSPGLVWHFIGPIQSNKTRDIAGRFQWVHGIDRLKIARRLSEQRPRGLAPLQVCIQVNVSEEANKAGVSPDALPALAEQLRALPNLKLRGLMCIPAKTNDAAVQHSAFRRLAELRDGLNAGGLELDTLSMGMSGDLEAAIAEGATIVRVGTDIFGARVKEP